MSLFKRLEHAATIWQITYFSRFPLLILLFIVAFMPLALYSPLAVLIGSFYDLAGFWRNFWFSLFAFLLAFTVVTTVKIILVYSVERFEFDKSERWLRRRLGRRWFSFDFQSEEARWKKICRRFARRFGREPRIYPAPSSAFFLIAVAFALVLLSGALIHAHDDTLERGAWRVVGLLAGFAFALFVLLAADLIHRTLYHPKKAGTLPNFLFPYSLFPLQSHWFRWLGWLRDKANQSNPLRQGLTSPRLPWYRLRIVERGLMQTPRYFGRGYLVYRPDGEIETEGDGNDRRVVFQPGYSLATTMFFIFLGIYLVVGYSGMVGVFLYDLTGLSLLAQISKQNPHISAVSYVMLLLAVLCWAITALTFLFDRFRVPVLLVIVLLLSVASWFSGTDHFYEVRDLSYDERRSIQQKLQPLEVFGANLTAPQPLIVTNNILNNSPAQTNSPTNLESDAPAAIPSPTPRNYVIVVAADGGGIQAAAWTARVLTGLEKRCRELFANEPNFAGCANRIRLISSVSGGSVGAMHFVNAYNADDKGFPASDAMLEKIVANAKESSLDQAAWGLTYPDFARSFIPFQIFKTGRGQALEEAWVNQDCDDAEAQAKKTCSLDVKLSSWRAGVRAGWRPANIFNATIAETGERLLIGTTDICATDAECTERLDRQYKDCLTTEQLSKEKSASGARIQTGKPRCQEYKSVTAGRWNFYDLLSEKDVAVATAARLSAGFPYVSPAARADSDGSPSHRLHLVDGGYYDNYGITSLLEWLDEALKAGGDRFAKDVLIIQIRSNKSTGTKGSSDLNNVAGKGWYFQIAAPLTTVLNVRTTGQLSHNEVLMEMFQRHWTTDKQLNIQTAVFQFDGDKSSPLSWHLTESQKNDIETAWRRILCNNETSQTDEYAGWKKFSEFIKDSNQLRDDIRLQTDPVDNIDCGSFK